MNAAFIKKAYAIFLTTGLLLTAPAFAQASQEAEPVKVIASLDVPRYMGAWYEIAKFPNWFQKKCIGNTKALYVPKDDGSIQVLNSCKTANGEISRAEGLARQLGPADSPKLEVRFAPAWLGFLPFVWGDYWVIDIDPQYQVAAVSDPNREYLWILSRTPQLDKKVYQELLHRLQEQRFDIRKLEITSQAH
jgi:apolipoprotein D and lipocalin family protein